MPARAATRARPGALVSAPPGATSDRLQRDNATIVPASTRPAVSCLTRKNLQCPGGPPHPGGAVPLAGAGDTPDEVPSFDEARLILARIFDEHGGPDGVTVCHNRFLWKAVVRDWATSRHSLR